MSAAVREGRVRGWDPLVRLTHWGIAAVVLVNGLLDEGGSALHIWLGYGAFSLLALRLVWGLIGTEEARFSAFPPRPAAALGYAREMAKGENSEHRSHNPLGALMVYALWGTLIVVTGTGIAMAGSPLKTLEPRQEVAATFAEHDEAGENRGERDGEEGGVLKEVHEVAANLLLVLAALHVAGVAFETRRFGTGFVRGMVTGTRSDSL
ncbi:cytochrome b/b6 domain-containing protein [Afifella sp. IM 167]|uniref:cytochrome b/b6 domain-containing protein n=1 Tax=Afifella sp. IM 167 TaxID=2033586 RepID=UPI001CCE16A0|nr:cytochrome b/b6 domain-containing protein [Afifella sp. IM 167]MBZ8132263.1 cytochrome b [Afifella sp. IM 167]